VTADVEVHVDLMGRLYVSAGQLRLGPDDWPARRAADLVALLALADGHRLDRDQVVDALWRHLTPEAGAANLRKAAHHARQALHRPDAVVLRGGQVRLFPSCRITTDVGGFETAAAAALGTGDAQACADAASWPAPLRVAVNLSPAQFGSRVDLDQTVADALREAGLEPDRLELEITEGVLLNDTDATVATLNALKALGVRVAMDDFAASWSRHTLPRVPPNPL